MSTQRCDSPFKMLTNTLTFQILKHLDIKELCIVAQVSKHFHALANSDYIWKLICIRYLGHVELNKTTYTSWKSLFQSSGMELLQIKIFGL